MRNFAAFLSKREVMRRDVLAAYFLPRITILLGGLQAMRLFACQCGFRKFLNNKTDFTFLSFIFLQVWVGVSVFLSGDILLLVLRIFFGEFSIP